MAEAKTKPTSASVDEYLASKAGPEQLADCKALMTLLKKVTKESPKSKRHAEAALTAPGYLSV
jgi:hypothetical protein